ncbi:MAG: ABC transporter permease [Planctomycetia bacterium]|nr:ABC transporter permease [Planctomycetia bacterium]
MFDTAIWRKTWGDQRVLVLSLVALWTAFPWIYIWLSAQIPMPAFQDVLLRAIPQDWQRLSGVPFSEVATHAGRVALAFVDPVVVLAATVFGITRGSDAVSGPLERGTMEMVLAQPVTRWAVFISQALATVAAAAVLAAVLGGAAASAVALGPWSGKVDPLRLVPAALNVFGLMVCMAGISACVSAADSYRWRTIGIMCGFYVFSILAKLVGRLSSTLAWCGYLSILNAYEPQRLVGDPATAWRLLLAYDAVLLGLGLAAYVVGGWIFARRDLPAPL